MKKRIVFLCFGLLLAGVLAAAGFSPWDAWRQGYSYCERGRQLREKGEYVESLEMYRNALRQYQQVRAARPDWNQKIIRDRMGDCERAIADINKLLGGGTNREAEPKESIRPENVSVARTVVSAETLVELRNLRSEVERYKKRVLENMVELEGLRRQLAQSKSDSGEVTNLLREQRQMREKYELLQKRYAILEKKALEPDEQNTALRNQLLEEKLNSELIGKRLTLAEKRLREFEEKSLELKRAERTAKELARQKEDDMRRMEHELKELQQFQSKASARTSDLKKELETLNVDLREEKVRFENQAKELEQLRSRLNEALRNGGDSSQLNAALQNDNRSLRNRLTAAETECASAQELTSGLQNRQRELQLEIVRLKETMQRLEAGRTRAERLLFEQKKDGEKESAERKLLEIEIKNLRDRNRELETSLQGWSERYAKLDERYSNRAVSTAKTIETAENDRKRTTAEWEKTKVELAGVQAELEKLRTDLSELRKAEKELRAENVRIRGSLTESEKSSADWKKQAERRAGDFADAENELKKLRSNFQALQSENVELRKTAATLRELQERLQSLATLETEAENLKKRLSEEQLRNESLSLELTQRSQKSFRRTRELADTSQKLRELQTLLDAEKKRSGNLAEQLAARPAISLARFDELEKELDKVKKALGEELRKSETLTAELAKKPKEVRVEVPSPRQAELEKELADTRRALNEEVRKAETLTSELAKKPKTVRVEVPTPRLAVLEKELAEMQRKFAGERARSRSLQRELKSRPAEVIPAATANAREKALLNEINRIKSLLEAEKKNVETLSGELARKPREIRVEVKVPTPDRQRENELEAELAKLKTEMDEIREKKNSLEQKYSLLQSQQKNAVSAAAKAAETQQKNDRREKELEAEIAKRRAEAFYLEEQNSRRRKLLESEISKLKTQLSDALQQAKDAKRKLAERPVPSSAAPIAGAASGKIPVAPSAPGTLPPPNPIAAVDPRSVTAPEKINIKALLAAGIKAEKNDSAELAIWNYRSLLAGDSRHPEANLRLGRLLLLRDDAKAAAEHLKIALGSFDSDDVLADYCRALLALERPGSVLAVLRGRKGLDKNPRLLELKARALAGSGKGADAEMLLRQAIRLDGKYASAYLELARLQLHRRSAEKTEAAGNYDRARQLGVAPDAELEKAFGTLLDERRELVQFMTQAAREAECGGDWSTAVWYYRQMGKAENRNHLAFALIMDGKYSAAMEELSLNRPDAEGELLLALAGFKSGDFEAAAAHAAAARKRNNDRPVSGKDWNPALRKELIAAAASTDPKAAKAVKNLRAAFR